MNADRPAGSLWRGVVAELAATLGAARFLRPRFRVIYLALLVAAAASTAGRVEAVAPAAALLAGLAGLFSGTVAVVLRRRGFVRLADSPLVVPYLPQLITLLALPLYLLSMAGVFATTLNDGASGTRLAWPAVLALSLDNVVRTELFFDLFEIFHVRFGPPPGDLISRTTVFVTRLLLDLTFGKLAIRLLHAAYYRSRGLGRGEDTLYRLRDALRGRDAAGTEHYARSVGESLRAAVDGLLGHWRAGGLHGERAGRCLASLREWALPYLERRARLTAGDERAGVEADRAALQAAGPPPPPAPPRPWLAALFYLALLAWAAVPFRLPDGPALALAVPLVLLLSWCLVTTRAWLDRLVAWRLLAPVDPARLPLAVAGLALCLVPPLMAGQARLFQVTAQVVPGLFGETPGATVNVLSALGFVVDNLTRTQLFVDVANIYQLRVVPLEQDGLIGGLLTLFVRTTYSLGVLGVLTAFAAAWFNRLRGFAVTPNAELRLREEAEECGPQADRLAGFHYTEIRTFLRGQMDRHAGDPELLTALAASGFLTAHTASLPAERAVVTTLDETICRANTAEALARQGRHADAVEEWRAVVVAYRALVEAGDDERQGDVANALRQQALSLGHLGRRDEAVVSLDEALVWFQALRAAGDGKRRIELAATRVARAALLESIRTWRETLAEYDAAIADCLAAGGERNSDAAGQLLVIRCNRALLLSRHGEVEDAVAELRGLIDQVEGQRGKDGDEDHLALLYNGLGNALYRLRRFDEQFVAHRRAVELLEGLVLAGRMNVRHDLAGCRTNLGDGLGALRRDDEALVEYRRAIEVYTALTREGDERATRSLLRCWNNLAITLSEAGRPAEAEASMRQVVELHERETKHGRSDDAELAGAWLTLGRMLQGSNLEEAERLFRQVIDARDDQPGTWRRAAMALESLGKVRQKQQRWEDALQTFRQALAVADALDAKEQPGPAFDRVAVAWGIGSTLLCLGRPMDALAPLEQAIRLAEAGGRRDMLALARYDLGTAYTTLNRWAEAEAPLRQACALFEALDAAGQPDPYNRRATAEGELGRVLARKGDDAAALEHHQRAVELARRPANPLKPLLLARLFHRLGGSLHRLGRTADAEAAFREAVALYEAEGRPAERAVAHADLAEVLLARESREEAATTYAEAAALFTQAGRPADAAYNLHRRGVALQRLGHDEAAAAAFAEAVASYDALVQAGEAGEGVALSLARSLLERARILHRLGRFSEAEADGQRAAERFDRPGVNSPFESGLAWLTTGCAILPQRRHADAETPLRQAVARLEAVPEAQRQTSACEYGEALSLLGRVLQELKRPAEAVPFLRTATAPDGPLARLPQPQWRRMWFDTLTALTLCLHATGQHEEKAAIARRAEELAVTLARQGDPTGLPLLARMWWAALPQLAGDRPRAEALVAHALALWQPFVARRGVLGPNRIGLLCRFLDLAVAQGLHAAEATALAAQFRTPADDAPRG